MTEHSTIRKIETGEEIWTVAFATNGEYLVTGDDQGVGLWRMKDGTRMTRMEAKCVRCLALSKDGRWIAAGTDEGGGVFVWDAETYQTVFRAQEDSGEADITAIDFSPDSTRLVVASYKGATTQVWDVANRKRVLGLLDHKPWTVTGAKYSPQGDRIATATQVSVRVWDSNDGRMLVDIGVGVFPCITCYNQSLLWSGDHLFVQPFTPRSHNKIIRVDASTGSTISEWRILDFRGCSCIALPHHGKFIACTTGASTVSIWDTSTHTQLGLLHNEGVNPIAFSDDRFLAIGSGRKIAIRSLSPIIEPDIQIDDAILDLLKRDQLANAEALLSAAITASQNSNHRVLASRALVRTRLGEWDAALNDAEQSIDIQPSVIGYVSKSVALVRKGEGAKGHRACDIALEHFHSTHVSFLLLIKAIIIFMAGEHKDAISRIDDLIATTTFNSACYVVQAYMYLLLGNSEAERNDYESAIQSFDLGRTQVQHFRSRPLEVISLIFGWKFDNLDITIRQRHCEALYAVGRIKEGVEFLLRFLHNFNKEVYTSGPVIEWVSNFTQRCLSRSGWDSNTASLATRRDQRQRVAYYTDFYSPSFTVLLGEWAKSTLARGSWKDSLAAAASFTAPRFMICRAICERLETMNRILDASQCFCQMRDELTRESGTCAGRAEFVLNFKLRCCAKLELSGDVAMDAQQPDDAIAQYSAALSLDLDSAHGLFIRRSKAWMTKKFWYNAINDANEAIVRDPSSPWGYETKHAVLHGAKLYLGAVDAFEIMLTKMAQSPDPNIRELRGLYINPSSVRARIRRIVQRTIRHLPHVLINTSTGCLRSRAEQVSTFESSPVYGELLSSMTTRVNRGRIKREVKKYFRYVMLSHKWEDDEPLFQHVIHAAVYDLDKSRTHDKLKMFCRIVESFGFNWAWSDTCCINKQDHIVLQETLVAMFKWYRNSATVIVYLLGVHSLGKRGDLLRSVWNTRAWTFQEYVAAKAIHFFTEDWRSYLDIDIWNHKESPEIISEMEQATGVSAQRLITFQPGFSNIREKLCLVSTRHTTLVEDAAYSLLGMFSVAGIPAFYGEGESALGRLLAHILSGSGEISVLAWTGEPSSINSCLPARISAYSQPATSYLPLRVEDGEMESTVTALRNSSLDADLAVRLYDHINGLTAPWFAGSRMKLSCIAFRLPSFSPLQTGSGRVYYTETPAFGTVEITTTQDLSRLKVLYLVHPWLDSLLGREDMQVMEDNAAESSSTDTDDEGDEEDVDEDVFEEEDTNEEGFEEDSSPLPEAQSPLPPVLSDTVQLDRGTHALEFIARLRRPFGGFLMTLASTKRREEYRRVATDALIRVQIQENVPLETLLDNVRILDVL